MNFSNALPAGENQGDMTVLAFRADGLDGHSTVTVGTVALTPYAFYALEQLIQELKADRARRESAKVEPLRKSG